MCRCHSTGKYFYAIVGEGGPKGDTYDEVSISLVWDFGYNSDGSYGPEGNFEMIIFPDTKRKWNVNSLNEDVEIIGRSLYIP